ncbi:MAG TPA: branched-chain amino acid ABC transporter permease [Chloroflexota bacterium]
MTRARLPVGWLVGGVVLLILALFPLFIDHADLALPTEVFIFALFAMSYDVVFGFTGLISFGQSLFVGAGAYALAVDLTQYHEPLWVAFFAALLTGIILSVITGALALRTRGVYFAMVTLAFAQGAFTLADSGIGNTNGETGLSVSSTPAWLTGPGNEAHFYYVALAVLVLGYLLLRLFVFSPAGRVWQAVRENEYRAQMIGYRPFNYKLMSYVIAGAVSSTAGALYAVYVGSVSTNLFSADLTIQLLLMVIIGGAGSLWGAIVGAALIRYLNHYLNVLSSSSFVANGPNWLHQTVGQPLLLFGIIYLFLVVFFPQGIAGAIQSRFQLGRSVVPKPGLAEVEAEAAEAVDVEVGESVEPLPTATSDPPPRS